MHLKDFKCYFFVYKKVPRGLKENLREEDNLSTRDNWPIPNVSFVWRFYCILYLVMNKIKDIQYCYTDCKLTSIMRDLAATMSWDFQIKFPTAKLPDLLQKTQLFVKRVRNILP